MPYFPLPFSCAKSIHCAAWLLLGWAAQVLAPAAELKFAAGPRAVPLIELYTSEGCSSCPPAERWLNGLRAEPGLWRDFVPVALHVDYWDRLGWRDVLAKPEFAQRQRAYAQAWAVNSIYTPCFVRQGVEWRPGRADTEETAEVGRLEVFIDGEKWRVEFTPLQGSGAAHGYDVYGTWLVSGVAHDVRRGENSGRRLEHEFVAHTLVQAELRAPTDDGAKTWRAELRLPTREVAAVGAPRLAIAAWVTTKGSLVPLQSVGGDIGPAAAKIRE